MENIVERRVRLSQIRNKTSARNIYQKTGFVQVQAGGLRTEDRRRTSAKEHQDCEGKEEQNRDELRTNKKTRIGDFIREAISFQGLGAFLSLSQISYQ